MGYAILRFQKIKSLSACHAVLRHNKREVDVLSVANGNKNPKIVIPAMQENQKYGSYSKFFRERTKGQTVRKDAVRAIEAVMTFSQGSVGNDELKDWLKASIDFLAENFGGYENIYDVQLHLDELSPHAHAVIIPIDENGKLCCRSFLGGSKKLRELQDRYFDKVKQFGLERGQDKKLTKAQHIKSLEWHKSNAENIAKLKTYELLFGKPLDWDLNKRLRFYNKYDELLKQEELKQATPKIQLKDLGK